MYNVIKKEQERMRIISVKGKFVAGLMTAALAGALAAPVADAAGITVYREGEKYVKFGGRVQLQYHGSDAEGGPTSDTVFFRRLRPYVEGSVHKDWTGRLQIDFGKASGGSEVAVKDAFMQYSGIEGVDVKIGNVDFPFSREKLTSSKKQQLIERTFVGDHDYGTPDKQLGVHLAGDTLKGMVTFGASVASASIDPGASKLDFDTPVNRDTDFNEGWIIGGRVDIHPFGQVEFSQGDFYRSELKAALGAAAFVWNNDGDNNGSAESVESVTGYEVSAAVRFMGASIDAEYNLFFADAVDTTLTSDIYSNGTTDLKNYSVEGGYMVIPARLEIVAGLSGQDADGYTKQWTRIEFGANWFFQKHDIKVQATYRVNNNVDGSDGSNEDEVFVQAQYVF